MKDYNYGKDYGHNCNNHRGVYLCMTFRTHLLCLCTAAKKNVVCTLYIVHTNGGGGFQYGQLNKDETAFRYGIRIVRLLATTIY